MRSLVAITVGHAVLAVGWGAMARSFTRRDAFVRAPLRRPAVVAVAGLTAALWAITGGFAAFTETLVAPLVPAPDWPETLATVTTFTGPVAVTALTTHLAGGGRARRFALGYGALVGPALVLTLAAPLLPTGWWLVAGAGLLGLAMAALPPVLIPWLAPTRALEPDERAALAPVLVDGGAAGAVTPDGIRVRVLALGMDGPATAVAAGVLPTPGGRVVFVTERVLGRLQPPEATAVVAHELGHHRARHVPLRLGAAAAFLLPWLGTTAAGVPGAFLGGLVLTVPAVLALLWLVRWTEFDADRRAAATVGAEPTARALRRLTAHGVLDAGGGPLSLHPSTADRVRRLRDRRDDHAPDRLPEADGD